MQQTVLITGGLGFIGSNLVRKLLAKTDFKIIVFDKVTKIGKISNLPGGADAKKRITLVKGDICNKNTLNTAVKKANYVIHLAALTNASESIDSPEKFFKVNVMGTLNVMEACEKNPVKRIIVLSSSEVYGNKLDKLKMDENHPLSPVTPYAVSKMAAEQLALSYFRTKSLPVVILRAFNVYGPFQYPEKMVPIFISRLLKNQTIKVNNGGKPMRDWIYVEDIADAIIKTITYKKRGIEGNIFNLGTGKPTSIKKVAERILKTCKKDKNFLEIDYSPKSETMQNVGISSKALKHFGWKSRTSFSDGIQKTVKWYAENN